MHAMQSVAKICLINRTVPPYLTLTHFEMLADGIRTEQLYSTIVTLLELSIGEQFRSKNNIILMTWQRTRNTQTLSQNLDHDPTGNGNFDR